MNKRTFVKRFLTIALSAFMILSLAPVQTFAITYNTAIFSGRTQSGNNEARINYRLTTSSAGYFYLTDDDTSIQLDLKLNTGWYLEKWDTWFEGWEDIAWAIDPSYNSANPALDGKYTFTNADNSDSLTNDNYILINNLDSLYGDFRVDAVVWPIITINAEDGVSYSIMTPKPLSTDLPDNQVAVKEEAFANVSYSAKEGYIITDIASNISPSESDSSHMRFSSVKTPIKIDITSRLKQHNVSFDSNGGEGTMSTQTFEYGTEQMLSENAFKKTGYMFAGWNTASDGSGTSYDHKNPITFYPENDGDSVVLYAQWEKCTNHQWDNGICINCGITCPNHNIFYIGSGNMIAEKCESTCNHAATATIERDDNISTVYTGSAIEALKVTYSENWVGGDLTIAYANNIAVGNASGTISISSATATENFNIDYLEGTPDATIEGTLGTNGWYISSVNLIAPEGYTIAKTQDGLYNNSLTYSTEQNEKITYYLKNTTTGEIAKKSLSLKIDLNAPLGEIDVADNKWSSFWNGITFDLLFNKTQDVTITASDSCSNITNIDYYLSSGELTLDEVLAITDWQKYTDTFKIAPNNNFVIYAKITDESGRIIYINSDGIVLDNIAPTLEGIEDGKSYYGDLTVIKPAEQVYDIKSVTLDGSTMDFEEGTYGLIPADNKEHTVIVEDNAGNKTTYTVTVYKNYTVTYNVDGKILSTETVGYGMNATLPTVPAKDGYIGKWDHDGKNITDDTIISAVYTEFTVPGSSASQSAQTGDDSNLWLLFALIILSCGGAATLTVVNRKRS